MWPPLCSSWIHLACFGTAPGFYCAPPAHKQQHSLHTLQNCPYKPGLIYRVRQKILPPWGFLIIFLKRLRIFRQNFTRLLSIQIYDNMQNFIQLSPTLTKLCRIKRDHPPNFYISQHVHHEFY